MNFFCIFFRFFGRTSKSSVFLYTLFCLRDIFGQFWSFRKSSVSYFFLFLFFFCYKYIFKVSVGRSSQHVALSLCESNVYAGRDESEDDLKVKFPRERKSSVRTFELARELESSHSNASGLSSVGELDKQKAFASHVLRASIRCSCAFLISSIQNVSHFLYGDCC